MIAEMFKPYATRKQLQAIKELEALIYDDTFTDDFIKAHCELLTKALDDGGENAYVSWKQATAFSMAVLMSFAGIDKEGIDKFIIPSLEDLHGAIVKVKSERSAFIVNRPGVA